MPQPLAPSPEERALVLQALHEIALLFDGLAPKVRHAFLLPQLERIAYVDMARALGVSALMCPASVARAWGRYAVFRWQ